MKTLWNLKEKSQTKITGIDQSLGKEIITRLLTIGFKEDADVTCVKSIAFQGPRSYQITDSIFSLEKKIAERIFISDLN